MDHPTREPSRPLFGRGAFEQTVEARARDHAEWVDGFGLHTGFPGPLDDLIRDLESALELARQAKDRTETED